MNHSLLKATFALLLGGVIVLASGRPAAAIDWAGGTGDYDTAANWTGGAVPAAADVVTIASGEATRTGNLERSEDTTLSGVGSLVVDGRFLNGANQAVTFNVADNATLSQTGNYFIVAFGAYDSTFNQTGGTVNVTLDRGFFLSDNGATGSGLYNAFGGVMNVEMNSTSTNNLHNFQAGRRGVDDTFHVDGGDVNFLATTESRRMYFSRDSVLQVDSGAFDAEGFEYFVVGYGSSTGGGSLSGSSSMNLTGGAATILPAAGGAMVVGDGQDGVVNVTGGALTVGGDLVVGSSSLSGGPGTLGSFNQDGGEVQVSGTLTMGAGAAGVYAMQSGNLRLGGLARGGDVGSHLVYEGGTVTIAGNHAAVLSDPATPFAAPKGALVSYNASLDETTITEAPGAQTMTLRVNTTTGDVSLVNPNAGLAFTSDYYEISSPAGALNAGAWNSLAEQVTATDASGDYNGDSVVDAADYTVWRDTLGDSVTPGSGADGNGDGTINTADYDAWVANYGASGSSASWTEAGGSDSQMMVEYVLDEGGYSFEGAAEFDLGAIFNTSVFGAGSNGDLEFKWQLPNGYLATGVVEYVSSAPAAAGTAPEPSALLVCLVGFAATTVGRRRRG